MSFPRKKQPTKRARTLPLPPTFSANTSEDETGTRQNPWTYVAAALLGNRMEDRAGTARLLSNWAIGTGERETEDVGAVHGLAINGRTQIAAPLSKTDVPEGYHTYDLAGIVETHEQSGSNVENWERLRGEGWISFWRRLFKTF